jgi:hypothetical protein
MRTNFAQIFWGLLLVILDFSINGFDLLIDGVGYLVVAAGCGGLSVLSPRFTSAQILCWILAVLWLISFAVHGEFAVIYGFATTVVNCTMIWQLLGGIRDFALDRKRPDLAQRAETRRIAYAAILIGSRLAIFALRNSRDAGLLIAILVISMLVLIIMILHLIHRVKTELAT